MGSGEDDLIELVTTETDSKENSKKRQDPPPEQQPLDDDDRPLGSVRQGSGQPSPEEESVRKRRQADLARKPLISFGPDDELPSVSSSPRSSTSDRDYPAFSTGPSQPNPSSSDASRSMEEGRGRFHAPHTRELEEPDVDAPIPSLVGGTLDQMVGMTLKTVGTVMRDKELQEMGAKRMEVGKEEMKEARSQGRW
ncbi:hypothetical protein BZG36_01604 [Bifiguratus adelaidae]|uniref:Uncharacterized protein n=1 Tax=Bifiguratus adelaidae TaxID=1938954 RepID=A0A261Y4B2_9FUNG|nr:hypothetical protein BZG36_01604 [Bifiguratus adelaidae]